MLKGKRIETLLLIILIVTAVFFRFYRIRDYVVFLGDEGRDMIILRNIFVNKDIPFLGPTASVGGFYLGPIYYWMAAPFLLLWHFDPIGPSYMVALFGVATVLLLYKFLKDSVGFWPAILSGFLYSTAPLVVRYSRSSWNPNPLPFFSLLLVYCIYLAIKNKRLFYFIISGASLGVGIQLHYLGLILAPIAMLIILLNEKIKRIPFAFILFFFGAVITFSPFLIFEIKNNFPNFTTILEFATRGSTIGYKPNAISWMVANHANIFLEWVTQIAATPFTKFYLWITSVIVFAALIAKWKTNKKLIFSIVIIYFIVGVFFIRLYSGQIHDYYFGSLFPAPFLLFGVFVSLLWHKSIARFLIIAFTVILVVVFISKGFFRTPPNKLIEQTENIAGVVIEKSKGNDYNFALISDSNSDHAYRYFLEIKGHEPKQLEEIITDQLLVVCESEQCSPLGHPIWEIAGFGRAQIVGIWDLPQYGFKIFRLTHWPGAPSPAGKPAIKGI